MTATGTGRTSCTWCCSTTAARGILGTKYEPVLKCIRCGACLDHCPVYGCIGGHAYGSVYTGPIGAVLTPLLEGLDDHDGAALRLQPVRRLRGGVSGAGAAHRAAARAARRRGGDAALAGLVGPGLQGVRRDLGAPPPLGSRDRRRRPARAADRPKGENAVRSGIMRAWTDSRDLPSPARRSFGRLWAAARPAHPSRQSRRRR